MTGVKNYLHQNIKSLRTAYGESQLELAYAIGLDSSSAISNYESGTRSPKPEVRKKIAEHFRITEEQLIHVDLSEIRKISLEVLSDIPKVLELTSAAFPVVRSKEALKNRIFANGYNAHKRIEKCMLARQEPNYKDCEICLDYYVSAFEDDAIPEAAGNILWFLLMEEYNVLNPQISEGAELLKENKISGIEFGRQYYLKKFDLENEDDENVSHDKESTDNYNDIEEIVQYLLKKLQSSRLSDLAYYYMALRYACGIVKNELSQEMNQAIGNEMLWAISELGNKYAKNYLQVLVSVLL